MGADASIYSLIRPVVPMEGPLESYGKMLSLSDLMDRQGLNQLQRRKLESDLAEEDAFKAKFQGITDPSKINIAELFGASPTRALAYQKTQLENRKTEGEIQKNEAEVLTKRLGATRDVFASVRGPQDLSSLNENLVRIWGPEIGGKMAMHTYDPNAIAAQLTTAEKRLDQLTPKFERVDVGGQIQMVDMNPFTNPAVKGMNLTKSVSPDTRYSSDQPTYDPARGAWIPKPGTAPAGGAPAAPQPAPQPSPVPGANASYKGANPLNATTAAIAKMKAEIAASKDPEAIAVTRREIADAARAVGLTPQQVDAIQPATAQPSAYDSDQTVNMDARDLRLRNAPQPAPRQAAGPTAIPVLGPDGKPLGQPLNVAREDTDKLRQEFEGKKAVKDLREVIPLAEQARNAPNSSQGDIALIYAVGKIMDPGSVVREGEMNLVIKSGSPEERLKGFTSYLEGGGRLAPSARANLQKVLDSAVAQRQAAYDAERNSFAGIVQRRGYNPEDVFVALPKSGGQSAPAAPTKVTQADIDAELRRRGVIK